MTHIKPSPAKLAAILRLGFGAFLFALGAIGTPVFAEEARNPNALLEGGDHAHPSALASRTLLLDVARAGRRLVAVGEYGHIIYSENQGDVWVQAKAVPSRATLTSVFFIDDDVGFAVGHDAIILKTIDGGDTWNVLYENKEDERPLFGVYFTDANHGLAIGAFSLVLETHNGGKTWTSRPITENNQDDFHLNDIFASRNGTLYIAAEYGTIYRSNDGGKHFVAVQSPYEGSYWSGMGLDNGSVLIWGMRGNAYYSRKGRRWQAAVTNTDRSIMGGAQLQDGTIILTGLSGLVLTSKDDGKTFTETVRNDRNSFAAVSEVVDDDKIRLYGSVGVRTHSLK